jgi:class 3 adenylate cyclase/tetratricopeptide (TPR) repeat protein
MECGNTLVLKCSNCEEELGEGAKFCMSCGHKVAAAPAPAAAPARDRLEQYIPPQLLKKLQSAQQSGGMQGERRVVTMLFCDVQGSTAAAEQLDPEDWAEIMNGAFEHLIAPVYRYEGTLARLMGDAVLAFFGAPIAHEDDPERAMLAGLAIVQEIEPYAKQILAKWNIELKVRVGINTGLVVVGEVGTDMRLEYTAMGDAVNLASRMESTAAPGTVQISESTHKRVAPLFELEALGPVEVKGKSEPVDTYRVVRPKAKPGRLRGIEGLDSPMVGRERELAALRGRVDALRRGAGQVTSIMAEAGLGKSRLAAELRKQLVAEGVFEELRWMEGRSMSYQTTTPYAPIVDMLKHVFQLPMEASSDDATRYAALETQVKQLGGEEAAEVTPFLASRLGIAIEGDAAEKVRYLDPPDLRRQTDRALVDFVEILSEHHPVVLTFEDLHWADPSTLELLPELMKLTERAAVMLVAILRPRPQDASWKFHEVGARDFAHRYLCVQLDPLTQESARDLVANLLRIEGLPESLRALILEKSEGNPFYVEEVIRTLIDSGSIVRDGEHWKATAEISNIRVPDTLAAVLTTRLDKLDDRAKQVAQTAAVIGRQFDFDTLASIYEPMSVVEDALSELQRRGIVRERSRRPTRTYTFKHVMTQEAAYNSLLMKTRREVHSKVANVIARIAPEHSGDIARHYIEAREPASALPHLVDAAESASRAYATQEALAHFEQALSIVQQAEHPDLGLGRRVYEGLGNAKQFVMDVEGTMATYESFQQFAKQHNDVSAEISALNKKAFVTTAFMGDVKTGESLLDQAKVLAEEIDCRQGMTEGCMIRCAVYTAQADFDSAYKYLDQGVALGDEMQAEEPMLYGRTHIANTMILMTEFERAWPKIQEAVEIATRLGNRKYLAELKTFSVPTYLFNVGKGEEGVKEMMEGIAIAEEIGAMVPLCVGTTMLGTMMAQCGQLDHAMALSRRGAEAANMTGIPYLVSFSTAFLGTSYQHVSAQLHPKMIEAHEQALKFIEMPLGEVYAAMVYCELGHGALALNKPDRALELFELGMTTKSAPIRLCRPRLRVGAALAHLALGQAEKAAELAKEAHQFAEEGSITMWNGWLAWADAHVAKGLGKRDEAIALFNNAQDVLGQGGLMHYVWQSALEASQLHAEAGNTAESKAKLEDAQSVANSIIDGIQDPGLKELYQNDVRRQFSEAGVTA